MYSKIFRQIFASSIAEDYKIRHIFMDLLVLAEFDGTIDMTVQAISGMTRVPEEDIRQAIEILMKPDPQSRTPDHAGARLIKLDDHRNWGWKVVNYEHYRALANDRDRKAAISRRVAKYRQAHANEPCNADVTPCNASAKNVTPPSVSVHVSGSASEGDVRGNWRTIEAVKLAAFKAGLPESEAEAFFDHYEANGWKVGRNPMRSLPHAISNWKRKYESGIYRNNSSTRGSNNAPNPRNAGVCRGPASQPSFDEVVRRKQAQAMVGQVASPAGPPPATPTT